MTIHFNTINSFAQFYPKAKLPVQPVFDFSTLNLKSSDNTHASVFTKQGLFFGNARTCLAHAFALSGVNADSAVLIPAYHCGSMVEPALWLNADVLLYQQDADLSPNRKHLEKLLGDATKPVRALLLPHYFGFPQDIDYWRTFCDANKLKLIEDCAHAFFGTTSQGKTLGTGGHYSVASVRKFFCSPDGGILIGEKLPSSITATIKPDFRRQLHATLQMLLLAAEFGSLGKLGRLILLLDKYRTRLKPKPQPQSAPATIAETTAQWSWFDPDLMPVRGLDVSRLLMKYSHLQSIIDSRRRNYARLMAGIAGIPHVKPLFPELPAHVVPYMFPVLLESGESGFDRLKHAGVPLWRWEELATSDCPVSQRYRLQLLQIPCHQNITASQIDWIIDQFSDILGKPKP
ncbi:MAG: DegT/DnrJ/EryC1/StrS family aminotransferase [Methylovulum sp.]|uniref:DegT/DnrJ/EryC1/StrS family aminotransferase n=1 Tax=Methylovulum sp. TaxID=1916980 RepID=UPI002620B5EF|nr:DegT/DnrJ/EryC1/StrS family aminotransferase [Methylovulum sp.]MDD2725078.1 DegT/DnrJ/EryC1/StrS family aminotransferase [Methylovulum sp.]MDD5124127.1 DegT/DnrJ/EryC1/StrS family aminotransferase [Methylovulum sp.]